MCPWTEETEPGRPGGSAETGDAGDRARAPAVTGLGLLVAISAAALFGPGLEDVRLTPGLLWLNDVQKWALFAGMLLLVARWEGEPLRSVGLAWTGSRELKIGLAAGAAALALQLAVGSLLLDQLGWTVDGQLVQTLGELSVAQRISLVVTAAVTEEALYRGFWIERTEWLSGSVAVAVITSLAVFLGAHGGQASVGTVVQQGVLSLLLCLLYVWRRNLTAPIVAHGVIDAVGLLLLPAVA